MKPSIFTLPLIILLVSCSEGEVRETTDQRKETNPVREPDQTKDTADTSGANVDSTYTMKFERGITYSSTDEVIVGDIATFIVDDRNRIFIADQDQTTIHVFNPKGLYLTSIGRQGKGPGEFAVVSPNTTIVVHSNKLYVTDTEFYFPHRAHVYSLEDLSFSHTMKLLAGNRDDYEQLKGYYPKQIYPRGEGRFLVPYHRSPHEYRDQESVIHYVIQDSTGTIVSGPILEQKDRTNLVYRVKNTKMPYWAIHSFPFFSKSLLAVSGDGQLYAANNTEEFKIDVYSPDGSHVRTFQHPFNNRALKLDRLLAHYKEINYKSGLGEGVALNMIREAENLPEIWPALETMFFDDADRLWVSTITEDDEIYEWWVLNEQGKLLARFTWPRSRDLQQVKNGFAYTLESDESTGLQKVVQYRVEMNK